MSDELNKEYIIKVSDFGLACYAGGGLNRIENMAGTPMYMGINLI
jgi:hypothetical protein